MSLLQAVLSILAVALIAGGIHLSNDLQERTRKGKPPARPPVAEAPVYTPPPEPVSVQPEPPPEHMTPEESATRPTTMGAWLSSVRGRISQFPPGTPEYERFARSLRFLFREDPAWIEKAASLLVEDPTLEHFAFTLVVGEIARADDSSRADAALRGLLIHEQADESFKMNIVAGLASAGRMSEGMVRELLQLARIPNRLGRVALESLADVPASLKREFVQCVFARHADFLAAGDLEGVRTSLNILCGLKAPESRDRIKAAFRHANPDVRAAVFRAVSAGDPPDRDDILIQALAAEQDAGVLCEAIENLCPAGARRPESERVTDALLRMSRENGHEGVRRAALGFFARRYDRPTPPPAQVTESIRESLRSDASAVNREYAEWILKERYGLKF